MASMKGLAILAAAATLAAPAAAQYTRKTNGDIEFQNYPLEALKRGEEGTVGIRLKLDGRSRLVGCSVTKPSGSSALDEASCKLLMANARMQPFLSADGRMAKEADGQVVWKLPADRTARIAQASLPAGPAPKDAKGRLQRSGDKVICRSSVDTGSLVSRSKTCLTAAEWKRQYDQVQQETSEAIKGKSISGSN